MKKHSGLYPLLYLLTLFPIAVSAQSRLADSIKAVLKTHAQDSMYVKLLVNLSSEENNIGDYSAAILHGKQGIELAKKLNYKIGLANCMNNTGIAFWYKGDYDSALYFQEPSIKIREELNDKDGLAKAYTNIGLIHLNTGNKAAALEAMQKGMKIQEEIGNREGIANSYINIGSAYYFSGDLPRTLDCMLKALKIFEELGQKDGMNTCYNNVGVMYAEQKNYAKAKEFFEKSLKLNEELKNRNGIASAYANIGGVYMQLKEYDKALDYEVKALDLKKEIGLSAELADSYVSIAEIYLLKKDGKAALEYAQKAVESAEKINNPRDYAHALNTLGEAHFQAGNMAEALKYSTKAAEIAHNIKTTNTIREAEGTLSNIYEKMGDKAKAYDHYKNFIAARDSLFNEEKNKELTQKSMSYEFEKQLAEQKAEQEKSELQHKAAQQQQQIIIISVIGGLLLMMVFSFFLYKRFRLTQQQNRIIENQKKVVEEKSAQLEEKNKEIVDSITYARRLQEAILPPEKLITSYFPEHFTLYKPKAIVAGDFYWLESNDDTVFLAAGDCTGHGVPGAMVSVVCSNALNRAIHEFGITEPGAILDKTRELVLDTFSKSGADVKDGMDISLCALPRTQNLPAGQAGSELRTIKWAGANNAFWYYQENALKEVAPDKQPVGKTDHPQPFTTHTINLKKGDSFYLFTDGFADQFGGDKGKKLKQKQLKEMIAEKAALPMQDQMKSLDTCFEEWKGKLEQVDDVTILGVRV